MASIADIFFKALLEDRQLQIDAEKAGDKAGATLGSRMSKGISTAMRAGLGVIAAGAAIATKGMVELEEATADFRSETGATEEEAKAAGKAILDMSSRNIQPIREIGKVLGLVHTEMGLTGKEAEATAEAFLHFARVTGRDAAEEVKSFDNILDAWGLTADDARGIMDKLVASHQKYGGSIAENETALASMAPQLKALNLTVDDGIGLLNLFASSGLDAASGQKALNAAIKNLPTGETLQEFLTRLSQVKDDGERARLAMEVFGTKAGAGLANAIKPGIGSLDQFKVSADEAAGATDRAREAVDSTFGARVQLLIKQFGAKVIEAGQAFGPLLTGAAGAGSLVTGLFGDAAIRKLVAGAAKAGKAAGGALSDGMEAVWQGAQGTIIGNFIASRIEQLLESNLVQVALQRSGLNAGAVFGKFMFTGEIIAGLAARGLAALGASPSLVTAVSFSGAKLGAVFQVAFIAGIAALALVGGGQIINALGIENVDLQHPYYNKGKQAGANFVEGVRVAAGSGELIAATIRDDWATEIGQAAVTVGEAIKDPITVAAADASAGVGSSMEAIVTSVTGARDRLVAIAAGIAGAVFDPIIKAAELAKTKQEIADNDVVISAGGTASTLKQIAQDRADITDATTRKARTAAQEQLAIDKAAAADEVQTAKDRQVELAKQLLLQTVDIATYGDAASKIAAIKAIQTNQAVVDAYHNGTPAQKAELDHWLEQLGLTLKDAEADAKAGAALVGGGFSNILVNQATAVGLATNTGLVQPVVTNLAALPAYQLGVRVGTNFAAGLDFSSAYLDTVLDGIASDIAAFIRTFSPAKRGPLSEGGGPEGWGRNLGRLLARGIGSQAATVRGASSTLAAAALPGISGHQFYSPTDRVTGLTRAMQVADAHAEAGLATAQSAAGGTTINVPVQGIMPIERPEDIIRPLQQLASTGWLGGPKRILYGVEPVRG